MRRLAGLALLAPILLAPALAKAQVLAVYGTFSPLHASNVQTGVYIPAGIAVINQEAYTSFWTPAFGGGVTFGIVSLGPVHVGFDLRGSTKSGTTGADTALGGIKLQLKPPFLPIKPYIQGSVGYLATRTPNVTPNQGGTFTNQYLAYEGIAGLDYRLNHFIDFRVLELGIGQGLDILGNANANTTLFTVNTGVVAHF